MYQRQWSSAQSPVPCSLSSSFWEKSWPWTLPSWLEPLSPHPGSFQLFFCLDFTSPLLVPDAVGYPQDPQNHCCCTSLLPFCPSFPLLGSNVEIRLLALSVAGTLLIEAKRTVKKRATPLSAFAWHDRVRIISKNFSVPAVPSALLVLSASQFLPRPHPTSILSPSPFSYSFLFFVLSHCLLSFRLVFVSPRIG